MRHVISRGGAPWCSSSYSLISTSSVHRCVIRTVCITGLVSSCMHLVSHASSSPPSTTPELNSPSPSATVPLDSRRLAGPADGGVTMDNMSPPSDSVASTVATSAHASASASASDALSASASVSPCIAPRKPKRVHPLRQHPPLLDAAALLARVPTEPGAHAELSTAELDRKMETWSRLAPAELEAAMTRLQAEEDSASRVLEQDTLYQMDVSLRPRQSGAVRVFWRDVDVRRWANSSSSSAAAAAAEEEEKKKEEDECATTRGAQARHMKADDIDTMRHTDETSRTASDTERATSANVPIYGRQSTIDRNTEDTHEETDAKAEQESSARPSTRNIVEDDPMRSTTTESTAHHTMNSSHSAKGGDADEANHRRGTTAVSSNTATAAHARVPRWYTITLDRRPVRAFESNRILVLPTEEMALCCAREYAAQHGHLNKLLMPLTDLCSGAMHVRPQAIPPRLDYLLSFYQNDNVYFRAAAIAERQDVLLEPVVSWFCRTFVVPVPRIVGIGHPHLTPQAVQRVREGLVRMEMNTYQVVALCVAAQFMSSLILPLALFAEQIDLHTALEINRAEEAHNTAQGGMIAGYHDIREADGVVKICACATAWRLLRHVPLSTCVEGPLGENEPAMEEAEMV